MGNTKKNKEDNNIKYTLDLEVKRTRINNTFGGASKALKTSALLKWRKLDNYLTSSEYSYISGLLKDCDVSVVSEKNIILTAKYESIIDNIYQNFSKVIELINMIMESEYDVILLTDKEFKDEVIIYKEHMNDMNYYLYKEEKKPLIIYQEVIEKEENLGYTNLVDKAIDVFGRDVVEIE